MTQPLSIVVPTLNEEKYIGKLLDSLVRQTVQPNEIVVVDAFSKDKTAEIVKSYRAKLPQLKLVQSPKSTISRQRNIGARTTTSPNILFLDADVSLERPDLLEKYLKEVAEKNADVAHALLMPLSNSIKDKVYFYGIESLFRLAEPVWEMAVGANIYFTRSLFEKIHGFDERIKIGEDFEIVQRASKNGAKFRILDSVKIPTSVRRFEEEGRIKFTFKMMRSLLHVLKNGYHNNPIEYKLGSHD